MDRLLLHLLLLGWISIASASLITSRITDRFLVAVVLAWTNLVATSLSLGIVQKLGHPDWFLGSSLLLASAGYFLVHRVMRGHTPPKNNETDQPNRWLQAAALLSVTVLAFAVLRTAYFYAPNNPDSLSYHLPRTLFYLGQGSLAHFDAADPRLVLLPFNYNLVQLFGLIYAPPAQCLNFFNMLAWSVTGVAVYRLCRLSGSGVNASLVTSWLALVATPVIAQAATTTPELATAAASICAFVFVAQWQQHRKKCHLSLAGLAAGLAAGSDLNALGFFICVVTVMLAVEFRSARKVFSSTIRVWSGPALLGAIVGLPFLFVNLSQESLSLATPLISVEGRPLWSVFWPLWSSPLKAAVNEDTVGFGFVGVLLLLGAIACTIFRNRLSKTVQWYAWLGLLWIGTSLLLRWNTPFRPRDFLPAALLLSPCVAALFQSNWPARRAIVAAVTVLVILATGISATSYLLDNDRRPFRPILNSVGIPLALPPPPQELHQALSKQTWINLDTDSTHGPLFSLMGLTPHQRFTARYQIETGAYNLLSRSSASRNAGLRNLAHSPAYTLLPYPHKPTAGVEYLLTVGKNSAARDYFALIPKADQTAALASNQFLLITISPDPKHRDQAQIRLAGLNPSDQASLTASEETADGRTTILAAFEHDGIASIPSIKADAHIVIEVNSLSSGAELISAIIPFAKSQDANSEQLDRAQTAAPSLLFTTDLVLSADSQIKVSDGLQPTEGPFPQWNLPYVRWAKKPSVTIEVPATATLARIKFHFSARLNVRDAGALEIIFNGNPVHQYRLSGASTWVEETLELTPQPGKNIIELRDLPLNSEPDWLDYLERNTDVKKHVLSQNIPLEEGARQHYEASGRPEGRIMRMRTVPGAENSFYFMFRTLQLEGFRTP